MKTILLIVICTVLIFVIYCARRKHEYQRVMTVFDDRKGKVSYNTRKPHEKHYARQHDYHQEQYNYLTDLSRHNKNGLQYVLEPLLKEYLALKPGMKPSPCNYAVFRCTERLNSGLINYRERYLYMNLRAISLQYISGINPRDINTALTYYKNGSNSYHK